MNGQEAFNKVVRHLANQRSQSIFRSSPYGCAYRNEDGLRCAIGCLIPDRIYDPTMEGQSVTALMKRFPAIKELFNSVPIYLLTRLQVLHDVTENWGPSGFIWNERTRGTLKQLAEMYNLSTGVLTMDTFE